MMVAAALAATLSSAGLVAQIPGRNVNMVSGTTLPDGDPYLQRQNEPSIAASTRNPLHLVGGANDYRTVDIPGLPNGAETGDAWLGVFKSKDGGQRWKSTLVPGYPQDLSAPGVASPLKGYQAAADPVVRAGTNGLFYYAGLVFDRGTAGRSAIFVARFIDNNNTENGDPVAYLGTRIVAANPGTRFLDKPWLAVDVPRRGATCTIPAPNNGTQQIPAGPAYVSWTAITGTGANLRSQIFLSRSLDCGVTWSTPVVLSRSRDPINQGSTIAIDPRTGAVIVAWRSFASPGGSRTDSINAARSIDFGRKFEPAYEAHEFPEHGKARRLPPWVFEHRGKDKDRGDDEDDEDQDGLRPAITKRPKFDPAKPIDTLAAFDQKSAGDRFRTNGYPTMTIDGNGRVYVAWTERGYSTVAGRTSPIDGDAKIVMATSSNGVGWTAPHAVSEASEPGHQFMPSLTFAGGKLMLIYYDLRDDISQSFSSWADDTSARPSGHRRTMDIRASLGTPGSAPVFAPSVKVSDYAFGSRLGQRNIEQMQFNPPNLPMFALGTLPFVGDYIDLTPAPVFVPDSRGGWTYNTQAGTTLPVFQAVWTDNRDVRPPQNHDWTRYSPPISAANPRTICDPGFVASRNQNIYTSRITGGLIVGSPSNNKPLNASLQRAFVVFAQNTTAQIRTFRMTIASQPIDGRASFSQFPAPPFTAAPAPPLATIDVTTAPRSLAARTVYVTSSNPRATVQVDVQEISAVGGTTVAGGLQGTTYLNPDITNPDITNPDITNPGISNPDITNAEVHNPDITNPDITNPDITNPDITNPDITNPDITNPDITNPDITNPDITNAVVFNPDITNPDITNPDITNPDITNPDITNPDITNPDITNGTITDVTWTMQNNGNTTTAYNVNLFLAQQNVPSGFKFQLVLHKVYNTPLAIGCDLKLQQKSILVANILNPVFVTPASTGFIDQNDPSVTNPTLWLAPGEAGRITLRLIDADKSNNVIVNGASIDPLFVPALQTITPVIVPQPVGTPEIILGQIKPPIVTPGNSTLLFLQQPTNVNALQTLSPAVTVQVRDAGGAVVPAASVTLSLGANPGGAVLIGGVGLTNASGIATFSGLSLDKVGTGYTLVATMGASGFSPATSAPFDVKMPPPPPPTFVQQPTTSTVGQVIRPAVSVRVRDGLGAALPGVNVTLSLGANPGNAVLAGGTVVMTGEGGFATFTGLSLSAAGTGYTLVATVGVAPFPAATSAPFNVMVPPPPAFVQQPSSAYAGQTISPAVKVQVLDGNNAVLPGVNVTLSLANPGGAVLTGGGPFTTDASGIATFAGLSISAAGEGYRLVATVGAGGYITTTSASFNVTPPPPPAPPAFQQQPTSADVGQTISPPVTVLVRDGSGAVISGVGVTLSLGSNPGGAVLTGGGPVVTDVSGLATFAGLSLNAAGTGYTLLATVGAVGFTPATSTSFNVTYNVPGTAGASANARYPNVGVPLPDPVGTVTLAFGQLVSVTATGGVTWYSDHSQIAGPNGVPAVVAGSDFLAPGLAGISLVARIGGGAWQFVGAGPTTLGGPGLSGLLQFAVNDSNYGETFLGAGDTNTGSFSVAVALGPPPPPSTLGPVGGGGGNPFGPTDCPGGMTAIGLVGRAGDDVDYTQLLCGTMSGNSIVGPTTVLGGYGNAGGGTDYGSTLTCPANYVMTGLFGQAGQVVWTGIVVDTLGVQCSPLPLGSGSPINLGPVAKVTPISLGSTPPFILSCAAGQKAVGIEGRAGGLLDAIAVRCQ